MSLLFLAVQFFYIMASFPVFLSLFFNLEQLAASPYVPDHIFSDCKLISNCWKHSSATSPS